MTSKQRNLRSRTLFAATFASFLWAVSCGGGGDSNGDGDGSDGDGGTSETGGNGGMSNGEGGTGASPDVPGELTLVRQYPSVEDKNANALTPITLEFSSDLDEASVENAIRVRAGGNDLPFTFEVNGSIISITLTEGLALPLKVSLSVSADLLGENGDAFGGDAWGFTYPLWQRPEGNAPTTDAGLGYAVLPDGRPFLATVRGDELVASTHEITEYVEGSAIPHTPGVTLEVLDAVATESGALLAWKETTGGQDSILVASYEDGEFTLLGGGAALTAPSVDATLVANAIGTPYVVSSQGGGIIEVRTLSGGTWLPLDDDLTVPGGEIKNFAAASAGARLVIASVDINSDILVHEWNGAGWDVLDAGIDRTLSGDVPDLDLAVTDDNVFLAYIDGDVAFENYSGGDKDLRTHSTHLQVAKFDNTWSPLGASLDLEINNQVLLGAITVSPAGTPLVAWLENLGGKWAAVSAEQHGDDWRVLGQKVFTDLPLSTSEFIIASDAEGNAHVASASANETVVSRFNGSPSLPAGIVDRGDRETCNIPADDDNFPATLADTGCYTNLPTQALVSAAIPFNINAILWSDRAYKKRYLLVPEGETMGYSARGAWEAPIGTIVIKEFYLEKTVGDPSSRFPVETRFLIKRCEEGDTTCDSDYWQGYSYKWNSSGTNATLLSGEVGLEAPWSVTKGGVTADHLHTYPSRSQCVECHNSSNRLLGVTGAQLNRPQEYDGVIDNQLRAWTDAGLLGETAPTGMAEELDRLPSPPDVGQALELRSRAYFQANCAHCHNPAGSQPSIDFRYYGAGLVAGGNICEFVVPGEPQNSVLFQNDSTRESDVAPVGIAMPPLATLLVDEQQLPVTEAWITSMTSCP